MKYEDIDYKDLIVRFLTCEIHKDEEELLLNWINYDKKNEALFKHLYRAWAISGYKNGKGFFDLQRGWDNLRYKMQGKNMEMKRPSKNHLSFLYFRKATSWMLILNQKLFFTSRVLSTSSKIAAAILILLLITWNLFLLLNKDDATNGAINSYTAEIYAPTGSRVSFSLPDGDNRNAQWRIPFDLYFSI